MSAPKLDTFDKKFEALKVWYAIFAALIDGADSQDPKQLVERFKRLREKILEEAPELAMLERKSDRERN